MRVNPTNSSPVQGATDTQSGKKADKVKSSAYESKSGASPLSGGKSESVNADISSRARDMAKAKQAASEAPDVRESKVAELREQIRSGKYNVSAEAIADRLVDDHLGMTGA